MHTLKHTAVFLIGAALYGTIELASRGWTHWSMLLAGGLCINFMYLIENATSLPYWKKWILSAIIITLVEFLCGIVFNLYLNWHIWDYSQKPYNILGQICPNYTLMWLGLSVPGIWLCRKLHELLN